MVGTPRPICLYPICMLQGAPIFTPLCAAFWLLSCIGVAAQSAYFKKKTFTNFTCILQGLAGPSGIDDPLAFMRLLSHRQADMGAAALSSQLGDAQGVTPTPSLGLVQVPPQAAVAVVRVGDVPIHHPTADPLPAAPAHLHGRVRKGVRRGRWGGEQQMQVAEPADEQAPTHAALTVADSPLQAPFRPPPASPCATPRWRPPGSG